MESRDLSTTTIPAQSAASNPSSASGGGGGGDDEVAVLSVTAALAKEALLRFQSRKYNECLEFLTQLSQKKEDDPKVLHNIAIAEYFRDGCSDPRKLLEVLSNVKRKSEELARASLEQVETVSNTGNKSAVGPKGITLTTQATNNSSVLYADEFDASVATLNIAIIWFHLHEYGKALSLLEPLYNNIEPIDETIALHICLLLLDVALASHDAARSADVLNYLEKAFGVSQGDTGSSAQQQSANFVMKSSSVPNSSLVVDAPVQDSSASLNASEKPLSRTLSDETLEYETMFSTLDIGGQNSTRTAGFLSSNDLSRSSVDKSIPAVDFKLKLQLYKVRFLLLTGNLKAAKREVKGAMNIARGRDSSMALLLKSQLEYARGNHRKAIKLLMALGNRAEAGISSMFLNNLGCIHNRLMKFHTSAVFFSKALSSSYPLLREKPLKLSNLAQDKSLLIAYNCGAQYLFCGKPILAARCLQKAVVVFYDQPLIWFRLAECCLMASEKGLLKNGNYPVDISGINASIIGRGKWRWISVTDTLKNGSGNSADMNEWSLGSDREIKLSMNLARLCLSNALYLLNHLESNYGHISLLTDHADGNNLTETAFSKNPNHRTLAGAETKSSISSMVQVNSNGDAKEQKGGTSQETISSSLSIYEDARRKQNKTLRQAIIANQAYVELELGNPLGALLSANALLQLPECSRIYSYLGRIYAAEALCWLNRPKEAAEHLSAYLTEDTTFDLPFSEEDFELWRTDTNIDSEEPNGGAISANNSSSEGSRVLMFLKPEEARATLYANLAAKSAIEGELQMAMRLVNQALSILPNCREANLTAIYIHLMLGSSQEALAKLKRFNHVRFLPFNSTAFSRSS